MLRVFVQDNHKIYLGVIYDPITKTFMMYIGLESGSGIDWYRRDVHIADVQKEGNK